MGFLAAGSLSLAQPWHPRMTFADFNVDGVVDQIETLIRMLGMWDGRVCEGDVFVEERPQMWNASTSSCMDSEYAEEGTPCSGQGCLWTGQMSWGYWGLFPLFSGLGSIRGAGEADDTTGCFHSITGKGSLDFGAGFLIGKMSASVSFIDLPARCQWPFQVGSQTKAGFVGPGGIPVRWPINVTAIWPMAEMGSWYKVGTNPFDPSVLGIAFGAGGVQGSVERARTRGPFPPAPGQQPPVPACVP